MKVVQSSKYPPILIEIDVNQQMLNKLCFKISKGRKQKCRQIVFEGGCGGQIEASNRDDLIDLVYYDPDLYLGVYKPFWRKIIVYPDLIVIDVSDLHDDTIHINTSQVEDTLAQALVEEIEHSFQPLSLSLFDFRISNGYISLLFCWAFYPARTHFFSHNLFVRMAPKNSHLLHFFTDSGNGFRYFFADQLEEVW